MRYAACPDEYYHEITGACSYVIYVEPPSLLPDLTAADAAPIAAAIIAACALAWGIKQLVRFIRQS